MHDISSNIVLGFIEIRVSGFWAEDDLEEFAENVALAVANFPGAVPR